MERLWKRMQSIYGYRWTRQYGAKDEDGTWAQGLHELTEAELFTGITVCISSTEPWPPTLPEFRAMCRPPRIQRENAAAYRAPPDRQLPHLLDDERRARGRQGVAEARKAMRP